MISGASKEKNALRVPIVEWRNYFNRTFLSLPSRPLPSQQDFLFLHKAVQLIESNDTALVSLSGKQDC